MFPLKINDHGIRGEGSIIVEGYAYLLVKKCLRNHRKFIILLQIPITSKLML